MNIFLSPNVPKSVQNWSQMLQNCPELDFGVPVQRPDNSFFAAMTRKCFCVQKFDDLRVVGEKKRVVGPWCEHSKWTEFSDFCISECSISNLRWVSELKKSCREFVSLELKHLSQRKNVFPKENPLNTLRPSGSWPPCTNLRHQCLPSGTTRVVPPLTCGSYHQMKRVPSHVFDSGVFGLIWILSAHYFGISDFEISPATLRYLLSPPLWEICHSQRFRHRVGSLAPQVWSSENRPRLVHFGARWALMDFWRAPDN